MGQGIIHVAGPDQANVFKLAGNFLIARCWNPSAKP